LASATTIPMWPMPSISVATVGAPRLVGPAAALCRAYSPCGGALLSWM
jgi:hypothetical protein